jgi:hypothetical protein
MSQSPTNKQPFNNPASQAERSFVLKEQAKVIAEQEARSAGTRAAYTRVTDPEPQGRWARPEQPRDFSQLYPRLPSGPWSGPDPVPPEEPFNVDISYVEPCGTHAEIERSLSPAVVLHSPSAAERVDPLSILDRPDLAGSPAISAPDVAANPPSFPRRKLT